MLATFTRRSFVLSLLLVSVLVAACSDGSGAGVPVIHAPAGGTLDSGETGTAYTWDLAGGADAARWELISGDLPAGLSLDPVTGVLSGTPTESGTFTFTVRATNDHGATDRELILEIALPVGATAPVIQTSNLPDGAVSVAYLQTLTASGTAPITWTVGAGGLPGGLALGESTGVLAGTPTTAGPGGFTVVASNVAGRDSRQFVLTIDEAPRPPVIQAPGQLDGDEAELPDATVDAAYQQTFLATGTAPIGWSVSAGLLPAGLALDPATGVLSGTPTAVGLATFSVTATNQVDSATQACRLTVASAVTLSQIVPGTAPLGATVVLTGTGFDADVPANNEVEFDSEAAVVVAATETRLEVVVPHGISGQVDVTVRVDAAVSQPVSFEVSAITVAFVDADATEGDDSGTSWHDAYRDLSDALAAGGVDQIWVAEGVYVPGTEVTSSFSFSDVSVFGGLAGDEGDLDGRDVLLHQTVLLGDLSMNDGMSFQNRADNLAQIAVTSGTVLLDGLIVLGGEAGNEGSNVYGGGLAVNGGSTTLRNCVFAMNRSRRGGAVYSASATLVVEDCWFYVCAGHGTSAEAGALYLQNSVSAEIRRSMFYQCGAVGSGGAAMSNSAALVDAFRDCVFAGNSAGSRGGALFANDLVVLEGCTIYGNSSTDRGGGAYLYKGGSVHNCIVRGNTSGSFGAQFASGALDPSAEIDYCNLQGGVMDFDLGSGSWNVGAHLIDADPNFADPGSPLGADGWYGTADDGLVLVAPSTSIDAGTSTSSTLDLRRAVRVQGAAQDLGAYETTPGGE